MLNERGEALRAAGAVSDMRPTLNGALPGAMQHRDRYASRFGTEL